MIGGHVPLRESILQLTAEGVKIIRKHAKGHVPSKVIAQVGRDRDPGTAKWGEDRKAGLTVQGECFKLKSFLKDFNDYIRN